LLVTLVASAPEVQYVALRNIDLLLQAKPDILSKELRVFFCKYNDPPYVKLQKLEIMVRIANDKNVDQLLAELKEYALEVDMDFVRRAVKAIGQAAIKIESASEKCVNTLLDLIATKVNYVVQEAIVVIKDIFRKYPGYEGIIPTLCKYIDELDEPNARGALIWIVGEYAEKISNADEILSGFVEGFMEEFTQTQLQILTAVVKLFLKKPDNNQGLVQKVLQQATADNDNPDIRDRAYVYWRLLSGDLSVAKVNGLFLQSIRYQKLTGSEHHSVRQTTHHNDNVFPSSSSSRRTPHRTINTCLRLPQTTCNICRPWPLWSRHYSTRRHPRTAPERYRQPHRGCSCCPAERRQPKQR
jgi:AP-1 complex subunit beta-1